VAARIAARARREGDEEADRRLHKLLTGLDRWRAGGSKDDDLERALRSTARGIARGMQNTG